MAFDSEPMLNWIVQFVRLLEGLYFRIPASLQYNVSEPLLSTADIFLVDEFFLGPSLLQSKQLLEFETFLFVDDLLEFLFE